ncbi:MAG: hypothetical protein KME16_27545 [Scytolyngbya sp. HA4215-MV1]|nr:hypothetical protein [Scytolyngbya sp. HA4215-MV1]
MITTNYNLHYLQKQLDRYLRMQHDALYRIGTHADVLDVADTDQIDSNNGFLNDEQVDRVLDFLRSIELLKD